MFEIKTNEMGREILRLKWAEPFRPFFIKTADGKRRLVYRDMQVTITPLGKDVAMFEKGQPVSVRFPVDTVVAVEPAKPRKPTKRKRSNG